MRFEDLGLDKKMEWTNAFAVGYAMCWKRAPSEAEASFLFEATSANALDILRATCDDLSDELVTATLLGLEGMSEMLKAEANSRQVFGSDAVDFMQEIVVASEDTSKGSFKKRSLDFQRFAMAQTVAGLDVQIIPMLKQGILDLGSVKAMTEALDDMFDDVKKSSPKLGARLDKALDEVKAYVASAPKTPTPGITPQPPRR